MDLLSGEVETAMSDRADSALISAWFRMALLSGEVETGGRPDGLRQDAGRFRMALLSGEVET